MPRENVRGFTELVCCKAPKLRVLMPSVPDLTLLGLRLPIRQLIISLYRLSFVPFFVQLPLSYFVIFINRYCTFVLWLYTNYGVFQLINIEFGNYALVPVFIRACASNQYRASYPIASLFQYALFCYYYPIYLFLINTFNLLLTQKCPSTIFGTLKCLWHYNVPNIMKISFRALEPFPAVSRKFLGSDQIYF